MPITTDTPGRTPADVAVVGGGFVGMALALALARGLGASARIGLLAPAPRTGLPDTAAEDGRAVALSAASVRLLTALDVWPAVAPDAQAVTAIDITDSALKAGYRPVLLTYDNVVGAGADGTAEAGAHIVPNAALLAALTAAVAATPGVVRIAQGDRLTALAADTATEPDRATVTCADGSRLTARLIVAADGRGSPLRTLAGIGTVGWAYRQHGITVQVTHSEPHHGRAVQHFLPGGPFALLPMRGDRTGLDRTCITWSEHAREAAAQMAAPDDAFLAALERRTAGRLGTLALAGPRQSWPLGMFLARAFVARRVALAGDAAHNVHPIAGQGLNLGLQDIAALAEVIVDAVRVGLDPGRPEILARYERWRRFDTMTAAASFDLLNRLFSNDVGLVRTVRSLGLELVDRVAPLKRALVTEAAGLRGPLPRLLQGQPL